MSLIKEAIIGDLCAWFFERTGEVFIQAQPAPTGVEEAPRPTGLYGMVNIVTSVAQGATDRVTLVDQVAPDLDLVETVEGHRLLQVSINTFRQGAFDLISSVYTKVQATRTVEHFNEIGLGYAGRSEIRDVTIPSGGGLEARHQFDLFLHTVASDTDIILAIEALGIIGKTGGGLTVIDLTL